MLRSIKLSVDKPYHDPGSTITHTSTSYQVSKTPDFTVASNLIINVAMDAINLLEYRFEYDIQPSAPLYVRTRYHLNNGNASSWSSPIELSSNQLGFKSSNSVVATPIISASVDYTNTVLGELVVKADNAIMYAGSGTITSASWAIETTNGDLIYELPNSTDVLTVLKIPLSDLNGNNVIVASIVTHSNTNASSNKAQIMVVIKSNIKNNYFVASIKDQLYLNSDNYLSIREHSNAFTTVDIRILTSAGILVTTILGGDPYTPVFSGASLVNNMTYIVEARAHMTTGDPTPWIECYRGYAVPRPLRVFSPTITYDYTNMSFGSYIDFNGLSAQTVQGDEDNIFYLAIPGTTTLKSYRATIGRIYPTGNTFDLGVGNLFNIPNINYLRLPNGKILIDHNISVNSGNIEVAAFTLCDYNHISKQLTKVYTHIRPDERYGTGRTGSATVTSNNLVYYVPGEIFDVNGAALDLELRVYDVTTNSVINNIPLPVTGLKQNVALTEDTNGDIYMFGGTAVDTTNVTTGEVFATPVNNNIYKLDKVANTWTNVGSLTYDMTTSYRFRLVPLKDGNLLILNTTPTTLQSLTRSSYIFNPTTGLITNTIVNNPSNEHIGISMELYNGDRYLMSSTADLVENLAVIRTSISDVTYNANIVSASQRVLDLVVNVGATVYVRDPLLYNSITINGTTMASTGKLVWIDNDVVKEYFYNDRIITRNTTITLQPGATGPNYNNLVILGSAQVNIVQL